MGRTERGMQVRREGYRRYYLAHKAEKKSRDHQRYLENKQKALEYNRKWREENRERYNERARLRRKKWKFYGTKRGKCCRILNAIRARCKNPKQKGYENYGGRGIKCLLSIDDVMFLRERDGATNMEKASLHRINNDGDYTLENCRYLELKEHAKLNHRRNVEKDLTVK